MKKLVIVLLLFSLFLVLPYVSSGENLSGNYLHSNPSARDLVLALQPQPTLTFRGIERKPATPRVILDIKFDFDSTKLTGKSISLLQTLGKALTSQELANSSFEIIGHTDGTGTEEYNKNLSLLRAQTVKNFLVEQYRIPGEQLLTDGKGEAELLYTAQPYNSDNRRVEVFNLGHRTRQMN